MSTAKLPKLLAITGAVTAGLLLISTQGASSEKASLGPAMFDSERQTGELTAFYVSPDERASMPALPTSENYLAALRASGSCLHDELSSDPRVVKFAVELPRSLSPDDFTAGYSVTVETTAHGQGRVLGPEDLDFIGAADKGCRAEHVADIEETYHASMIDNRGPSAVKDFLECTGMKPIGSPHETLATLESSEITDGMLKCAETHPLAMATLAGQ